MLPTVDERIISSNATTFRNFCFATNTLVPEELLENLEAISPAPTTHRNGFVDANRPSGERFLSLSLQNRNVSLASILAARHELFSRINPRRYPAFVNGGKDLAFEALLRNAHFLVSLLSDEGRRCAGDGRKAFRDGFLHALDFAVQEGERDLVSILLAVVQEPGMARKVWGKGKHANRLALLERQGRALLSINGGRFWIVDDGRLPALHAFLPLVTAALAKPQVLVDDASFRISFNKERADCLNMHVIQLEKCLAVHRQRLASHIELLAADPIASHVAYLQGLAPQKDVLDSSLFLYRPQAQIYPVQRLKELIWSENLSKLLYYVECNVQHRVRLDENEGERLVSWAAAVLEMADMLVDVVHQCQSEPAMGPLMRYLLVSTLCHAKVDIDEAHARTDAIFVKADQAKLDASTLKAILNGSDMSEVRRRRKKKVKSSVRFEDETVSDNSSQVLPVKVSSSASAPVCSPFDSVRGSFSELAELKREEARIVSLLERHRLLIAETEQSFQMEIIFGTIFEPDAHSISALRLDDVTFESRPASVTVSKRAMASGSHRDVRLALFDDSTFVIKQHRLHSLRESEMANRTLVSLQHLAANVADEFTHHLSDGMQVRFIRPQLFAQSDSRFSIVERELVGGNFIKFNDNNGWTNPAFKDHVIQALSHFSYHASHGQYLIVDLQGIFESPNLITLTDPVFLTRKCGQHEKSNLGVIGVRRFFENHMCTDLCAHWLRY